MAEESGNRVSMTFRSIDELATGIAHAKTFGMRDITVTTIFHASSRNSRDEYVAETVTYVLDCRMLVDRAPEDERQLAYIAEARAAIQQAQRAAMS